ncbi:MAG: hypothetical protein RLZZ15_970 [Verrucomicrobiota bacterium]|jgi:glycosyltransferase involved in cell wall biosynthesis
MRILTVSNVPLERTLGSGAVILGYVDGLRARGHEVRTLDPRDYEWGARLRGAKRLRMMLGYTRATLRAVRREDFDLVEMWGAESWWAAKRLARRVTRPLLVGRSNGLEVQLDLVLERHGLRPKPNPAAAWLDRRFDREAAFREVDALTTVSEYNRVFAEAAGYQPKERLLMVENPLPDDWLGQPCDPERPHVLGFFGSWLPLKGRDLLIAALPAVLRAQPGWTVRLVGVGALEPAEVFPADVAARIEVVPFERDRVRLRDLYRRTAILVLPSAYESFGMVAAEAMSCGCAVVASPVGFAAGLPPEREVELVTARTPAAWAEALTALMNDEPRRQRLARAGHTRVQTLRWDAATDRLIGFYSGLSTNRASADEKRST